MVAAKKGKILITGAAGFVGQALAKSLINDGAKVVLVSRQKNFRLPKAKVLVGNLSDVNFCRRALKGIQTVYYLAGYKKNIFFHTKNPGEFIEGNIAPLLSFLNALELANVKQLVYLSSTIVNYVSKDKQTDGYALGKYISEKLLEAFAVKSKLDIKIVRSAAIYGPGDNFKLETANFIPATIVRVAKSKTEFVIWGSGKRQMNFIYINDLITNLKQVSKAKARFFVVGNSEKASVDNVAERIIRLMGKQLKVKHDLKKPDKQTQTARFNNLVKPKVDLDKGLEKTVNYYRKI